MRLVEADIANFRSIRKSGKFKVNDVTCLVGKNEAGKSSILQALYKVLPIIGEDAGFNVTDDYPRRDVSDYESEVAAGKRQHDVVTKLTYELEDDDVAAVASKFGEQALTSRSLVVEKAYGAAGYVFTLGVDEAAVVQFWVETLKFPEPMKAQLVGAKSATEAKAAIAATEDSEAVRSLITKLDTIIAVKSASKHVFDEVIEARIPQFLYFDEYYQMLGCDNIEALQKRRGANQLRPHDYPLLGLINLARLDLGKLLNPPSTRDLKNKLEGAGNHLTKTIVKYWSQNRHLQMRFDVRAARPEDPLEMRSGTNIWAEVYDTKHQVTTELGARSRGFLWFFSFLAWYSDILKQEQNVILLLDEPGLSLHGRAQADLLRYIEAELAPNHQVIYTTHSPFLVDPKHFDRVRIVQDLSVEFDDVDPESEGTKVLTDVLEATDDSLFPLQGALGYDLTQALFVGPNSLVVEGVSDLLYLQAVSGILESTGRVGLSNRWTITPVGGSDKVPTFVALLGARSDLNIVTLIDFQKKDLQPIENLWKSKLLSKKQVLTYAQFTGTSEADVEDLFGDDYYLELFNGEYAKSLAKPLSAVALGPGSSRIVARLEGYLSKYPLADGAGFSHYRPARHFTEITAKNPPPTEALDRFEVAFKAVNALLR